MSLVGVLGVAEASSDWFKLFEEEEGGTNFANSDFDF